MQKYKTKYWSVNLPTLWEAEASDGTDILYDKEGIGELVISTFYQEDGIDDEQLEDLASEHIDADGIVEDVDLGSFSGFVISYTDEGEYWCEWYLKSEKVLLFVSYNCDESNEEVDEDVVESILASLDALT